MLLNILQLIILINTLKMIFTKSTLNRNTKIFLGVFRGYVLFKKNTKKIIIIIIFYIWLCYR